MTRWLRGKIGGFLALLVIAGLVVGGLGWVTVQALRLEEQQRTALAEKEHSQAETTQAQKLQLALWRLDTRVYADLGREATRPYHEYTAQAAALPAAARNDKPGSSLTVLELLLTRAEDAPEWMLYSYLAGLESDWKEPRHLREDLIRHLHLSSQPRAAKKAPADDPVLTALNRNEMLQDSLKNQWRRQDVDQQRATTALQPTAPVVNPASQMNFLENYRNREQSQGKPVDSQQAQRQAYNTDRDVAARMARGQSDKNMPAPGNTVVSADQNRKDEARQPVVIFGPLTPLWLPSEGDDRLVLTRLVQIGAKPACQVTVLDWPILQAELLDEVRDLLPEARLEPNKAAEEEMFPPERAMTALPVKLDPGPIHIATAGWDGSSLRYGLALAWAAALVGILAVALGGWALLDLSERRIRFVSAVTHELRTPLTSLRLYLDMLTSGIVTDDKRKEEYLHTLNAETDRLNRLVGNVLDFSRLENQRPKLAMTYVTVSDLLYQVRATWEGRCTDAGKELLLENQAGEDALLYTDEQLVQQILGNLIDNACKYSRGAEDPRVWVRAREQGSKLVLEVCDRGPGVAVREQHSIFRAFRRGRGADVAAGGVGLGLALAQRWAGLLGGSLTLEPAPEGGACFRLLLPGVSK
jgi:signal transduction histidine kinase